MSLIQECLEAFGAFSGTNRMLSDIDVDKYTVENGAVLINMETAMALNEIYELDYAIECDMVHGIAVAKNHGVPVEEGLGDAMKSIGDKLSNAWEKVKKFFRELKDKVIGWLENAKEKFKEWRKKVSEFFKRTKGKITITVDGEDITVTRSDIEGKYAEASKNAKELSRTRDDLANAEHDRDAFARRANDFQQQAGKARSDAKIYKSYMDLNRRRYERAEDQLAEEREKAAVMRKKFKFTMWEYTNILEFNDKINPLYLDTFSGRGPLGEYEQELEAIVANAKIVRSDDGQHAKEKLTKAATNVHSKEGNIKDSIYEMFGVPKGVNNDDNTGSVAWSYFRNGATPNDKRRNVDTITRYKGKDLYDQLKSDHGQLEQIIKMCDDAKKAIGKAFDIVIAQINKWSQEVTSRGYIKGSSNGAAASELSSALSSYSSAFGQAQSVVNTFMSAWIAAAKEWETAIVTLCGGSMSS